MPFTYSGDPSASSLDAVRFLIGDVVSTDPMLQDAEINYLLATQPSPRYAAVTACRVLSRKYARLPGSRSIGEVSISYADLSAKFSTLARELAAETTSFVTPSPYLSGHTDTPHFLDHADQWANSTDGLTTPDLTDR